jgi:hypothetical protein
MKDVSYWIDVGDKLPEKFLCVNIKVIAVSESLVYIYRDPCDRIVIPNAGYIDSKNVWYNNTGIPIENMGYQVTYWKL